MIRVSIASDHAGFDLKCEILRFLNPHTYNLFDLGTFSHEPVDYPDYAEKLGLSILEGKADRGILICGSGVGASIAANKLPGIRAAICHDSYSSHQGVEHDDMNVLVLGAWVVSYKLAEELVLTFLHAKFSGEPRQIRRLEKIKAIENHFTDFKERIA
jgi:RpiB/LacA/LacB family sugar-phosphate isomerase